MTALEVSRESGLREDLVVRFVPITGTPNGPLFSTRQLEIAQYVKQLTEIGAPASTIAAAVEDLKARPASEVSQLAGRSRPAQPRARRTHRRNNHGSSSSRAFSWQPAPQRNYRKPNLGYASGIVEGQSGGLSLVSPTSYAFSRA
jgi:hypothetical protein